MAAQLVPKGVAHLVLDRAVEPISISFLLLPNLSMLAFSSAVEPLRMANQLTGKVLFQWETLSADGAPVRCSNGVELGVDRPMGPTPPGSLVFVCAGVEPEKSASQTAADWVRGQWRSGRTVGGLCTGAYTLAKAGILKGRKFTLHWENLPPFREDHPDLEPLEQLYVIDDRIMTCGGGSAATDLFLKLIYDRHGAALAQMVLNMCLHHIHRPADASQQSSRASVIGVRNETILNIIAQFDKSIEDDVDLDTLVAQTTVSRRQVERLFQKHLGVSPKQYLIDLRLQRGRALLAGTDMTVTDVAVACGFESTSHFARRFREKFGVSPHNFSVGRC